MFDFEVGDLVELTIETPEWGQFVVETTIAGILRRLDYTEYHFPIAFNLYTSRNGAKNENGFDISKNGRMTTIQNSFRCTVKAKAQGGRRPC
jgi:hypothetical protein